MRKRDWIRLIVSLSAVLAAGPLLAQTTSDESPNSTAPSDGAQAATNPIDLTQPAGLDKQQAQYAPALDGSGLIRMDGKWKSHLLLGATVGGGWDSSPGYLVNGAASGLFTLSPYFGIKANTLRTQYLFQYQPTITRYTSSAYSSQTMHVASATILGNWNERWNWNFKASGSHGLDSVRLLAPQQTVAVGEVPGTGSGAASYLPNAGTLTYLEGGASAHYRMSERDSLDFGIGNSYSSFAGLNERSGIATATVTYVRQSSPTLGALVYGQSSHYYGAIQCTSFGLGGGFKWELRDQTFLSLKGGPQLNTSACGSQQGFAYSAAFSTRLSSKSQVYLVSERQPTASYLGPGLWQVTASGGYQRQIGTKGALGLDVGYVKSSTLTTVNSYRGVYFDGMYSHRVGRGLNASLSYRNYMGDWQGVSTNRNVAMFSLAWTPASWAPIAGRIFQ